MAPTEILAEQHFKTLARLFANVPNPPIVEVLTGSTSNKDKVYAQLAAGKINIIVGTHALIQPNVAFRDLAFLVIDEQHRFGVEQRAALRQKGVGSGRQAAINPHVLVMTATPIRARSRSRSMAIWTFRSLMNCRRAARPSRHVGCCRPSASALTLSSTPKWTRATRHSSSARSSKARTRWKPRPPWTNTSGCKSTSFPRTSWGCCTDG